MSPSKPLEFLHGTVERLRRFIPSSTRAYGRTGPAQQVAPPPAPQARDPICQRLDELLADAAEADELANQSTASHWLAHEAAQPLVEQRTGSPGATVAQLAYPPNATPSSEQSLVAPRSPSHAEGVLRGGSFASSHHSPSGLYVSNGYHATDVDQEDKFSLQTVGVQQPAATFSGKGNAVRPPPVQVRVQAFEADAPESPSKRRRRLMDSSPNHAVASAAEAGQTQQLHEIANQGLSPLKERQHTKSSNFGGTSTTQRQYVPRNGEALHPDATGRTILGEVQGASTADAPAGWVGSSAPPPPSPDRVNHPIHLWLQLAFDKEDGLQRESGCNQQ